MVFIGYEYTNDQVKWKKIYWMNGEETKYSISNIGLVRNDKKDKILKMREYKGYLRVGLTHNGKQKEFLIQIAPIYGEDYFKIRDPKKLEEKKDKRDHYENFKK